LASLAIFNVDMRDAVVMLAKERYSIIVRRSAVPCASAGCADKITTEEITANAQRSKYLIRHPFYAFVTRSVIVYIKFAGEFNTRRKARATVAVFSIATKENFASYNFLFGCYHQRRQVECKRLQV